MLVLPRDGDADARRARGSRRRASSSSPTLFAIRAVGRDRGPDRASSPSSSAPARARGDRRPHVGPLRARPAGARCRRRAFAPRHRRHRPAAGGEGRRRDRRAARGRAPRSTRSRPSMRDAAVRRSDRARGAPRAGRADARRAVTSAPNFAIVAAGANAASPHHEPGDRVIGDGEVVLCDFGGTMHGYCSDITRMFVVGEPPAEVADAYAVLVDGAGGRRARRDRRHAVRGGRRRRPPASSPTPATATYFIHRTGHGIGIEAHEDPYIVAATRTPLAPATRSASSPGIYLARPLRRAPRGHRRRHRRRARAAQPGAARPRDRRLTSARDEARRRDGPRCSGRPAACSSAGSRRAGARSASATAGCCAASSA